MAEGMTAGEAGQVVAVAAPVGAGLFALLRWGWAARRTARADRAAKLDRWQSELEAREAKLGEAMAARMAALEHEVAELKEHTEACQRESRVLREAFILVTVDLHAKDPFSPALRRVRRMLGEAFPIDLTIPPDMAAQIDRIDANTERKD